jgi:biopolymer transport protein ExbD
VRIGRPERPTLSIPVVPLATVVLLLTLFFPLAGLGEGSLAGPQLPTAVRTVRARPDAAWIVVTPGEGGVARYRLLDSALAARDVTGLDGLSAEASAILERDPGRTLVIRADAGLHYGLIDEAIDRLRRAGARSILLETAEAR